jgi:hypothetical protein
MHIFQIVFYKKIIFKLIAATLLLKFELTLNVII